MDPDYTSVNEIACWDPTTEEFTMNVNGQSQTHTYQVWSNSMIGTGAYANEDFETKLDILSALEEDFLSKYYRIPLATTCAAFLLSYQVDYFTEEYNIMYGFGGLALMQYNYTDAEWASYVSAQGGTLNYS